MLDLLVKVDRMVYSPTESNCRKYSLLSIHGSSIARMRPRCMT